MQQPSQPTSPAVPASDGSAKPSHRGEAHADPYIERLRAASLVKSPNKRVNAEPLSSGVINPWTSPRAVSPTSRSGVSYADMVSRPSTPTVLLSLKKENARAAAPTQHSNATTADATAPAVSTSTTTEVIDVDADTTEVAVKEEEDLELNALALRRTRSGKQLTVAKMKNKKQRSKKNAKAAGKMPATIGKGLTGPSSLVMQDAQQTEPTPRSVSDVRKRRRASTDIDGDAATAGTVTRMQDATAVTNSGEQAVYVHDIGEILGFPRFEYSPGPSGGDRADPDAMSAPNPELGDVEMYAPTPVSEQASGVTMRYAEKQPSFTYARRGPDGSYSTQHIRSTDQSTYLTRSTVLHEGDFDDMYVETRPPMFGTAYTTAGPSTQAQGPSTAPRLRTQGRNTTVDDMNAGDRGGQSNITLPPHRPQHLSPAPGPANHSWDDANPPHAFRRPRSPSVLHPHPVHYAPGPFPNFLPAAPDEPAVPAQPAVPTGPIQPLAPAQGAPPPLAMTRPPADGWPRIQGNVLDLPYQNVSPAQAAEWRKATDKHVFIHFPGRGVHDRGNFGRLCAADAILRTSLGVLTPSITQPIAAVPPTLPNSNPIYYRVGNLTTAQRDRLLREGWVSTNDGTFGIISSDPIPPTFIGAWRHPERLGATTAEGMAHGFVEGMESEEMFQCIELTLTTDIGSGGRWRHVTVREAHRFIINSIKVRKIMLRMSRDDEEEPVALLYMESPTADATAWANFRERVRSFQFGGPYAGPPELITRPFYCLYCHSVDHPTHACILPTTPGARTSTDAVVEVAEEAEVVVEEEMGEAAAVVMETLLDSRARGPSERPPW
ncbi:uncharacterized protein B0H18DRAFT_1115590 [Fomitopsis serialis]|uniref:uncharacterized protein n=1 Tax=Fomitopsis serialis TaxID=139415 RepID=UPI0020084615|nr:uncharacterized protein B0H18DRAFT_1115590 [Neoantrodia serialis]KAH9932944.1 hypothetical protein B0H18DRAFT_1115590 [Neoantrodia serialis]